jgi:hypothetical protein
MSAVIPRATSAVGQPLARWVQRTRERWSTEPEAPVSPATLIVSSRHRLWQRHGSEGVFAIERAVGELCAAMAMRDLGGTPLYVDDSPLLTALGVLPADPSQAADVARVIREVAHRLAWTEEDARHILILGDDGIIPFFRLPNPSDDDDEVVLSDHPYGADAGRPLGEARGVGRMPDAGLEPLLAALSSAAAAHRALAAGDAQPLAGEAWGYSASIWKRAARGAYAAVGEPRELRLSPPLSHRDRPRPGADGRLPRFRYFNLHGLVDSPDWFGQVDPAFPADYPPFPVALQPNDLPDPTGAVVVAECCYGAHIEGRDAAASVALSHMAGGALAFYGATGVAYGGLDGPLVAADLLAFHLWQALREGLAAGHALARAKALLVADAMARQGYLDGEDEKTVAGFVLYGDPSLPHATPGEVKAALDRAPRGRRGVPVAKGLAGEAAMRHRPVRRATRLEDAVADDALVARARAVVAKQLPGFDYGPVQVAVAPARRSGHALAKGMPEPSPDGLGVAVASAAPRVITLSRAVPTCAGPFCKTVVRVTLDPRGHLRKLSLSH